VQRRIRLLLLAAAVLAVTAVYFSKPPILQDPSYHDFADQRVYFSIPYFLDVASNLPFLFVGIWGLFVVIRPKSGASFLTKSEKWPYAVFFLGMALTAFGSSYYHLHPTNAGSSSGGGTLPGGNRRRWRRFDSNSRCVLWCSWTDAHIRKGQRVWSGSALPQRRPPWPDRRYSRGCRSDVLRYCWI